MGRAPCCEKMGLKKGPWTPEEDQILISYIQQHGHGNWRALPKQAGLLRCGKSCRLRWINYLRPDIKRGNFTKEEEDTIIKLHELLGNRWSAIAARLPGRTDNEIKNVWHTHIKKKLQNYHPPQPTKKRSSTSSKVAKTKPVASPQDSSSEISTITDSSAMNMDSSDYFPQIDESYWSEETSSSVTDLSAMNNLSNDDGQMVMIKNEEMDSSMYIRHYADQTLWYQKLHKDDSNNQSDSQEDSKFEIFPSSNVIASPVESENVCVSSSEDDMDFWFNLFIRAEDLPELPEF